MRRHDQRRLMQPARPSDIVDRGTCTKRRPMDAFMLGVDDLLERDPFRFTRSDADLRRLEKEARRTVARPYWYLLRALVGIGEPISETNARAIWRELLEHRERLSATVGRPVPLRATAIDWLYLMDEMERPIRPVVVSRAALARVADEGKRDALTGLPRRARFETALARELGSAPSIGGSVVFIDLDGFKQANDRLGHAAGDKVLCRFARAADAALRKGDLVGRVGGDEFALALRGVEARPARQIVLRLRTALERECAREAVSFSFGVTALRHDDTPAAALGRADAAMYRQKRRRKKARITSASGPSAPGHSDRRGRRR